MRKLILTTIFLILGCAFSLNTFSAEVSEFKKNNPDGFKYEFARSYISALSYFHEINQRWEKYPPKKKYPKDDIRMIQSHIEYFTKDNANLRIAKNYMIKYMDYKNSLMRKVSDLLIVACDTDIALNNKAKNLWQDWLNLKSIRKPKPEQEKEFISKQRELELRRKDSDKDIIKASFMMTRVLLSENNKNDRGKKLAITDKQRQNLLENLDQYGKDVLDWGIKPGQSTLEASISVIREVLEDSVYTTVN